MTRSLLLAALALAACTEAPTASGPPSMPAATVETVTLAARPLERAAEYLATLSSRRSVTLSAQVAATVRAVPARPGAAVKQGEVLLQLDSRAEQASLDNLVATRESLLLASSYAKQRLERSTVLRGDGIVSQQAADQAREEADRAEASLRATDASIAAQRARLGFYAVTAPFDGVLGHVPVKVGDLVAPGAPLTSLTQASGLEAEVWVPVERTTELTPLSRVRLLDDSGAPLGESPVSFVAARADPLSQLVLLKAAFAPGPGLTPDQLVRARVVFSEASGVAVPTVAVLRQAGQTFVFVVEPGEGALKARRVPVTLGPVLGTEYQVLAGLQAGQEVVVSGLQQVGDGAPVERKR